ncbi:MAG: carbamate kinase [Actinomycetota bacterium]
MESAATKPKPRPVVVALGGNAIAPRGHGGTAAEQTTNLAGAAAVIADLVADGHRPVITHGNGPQVGNLLLKNEMAADVVPAMPLDWCVAQTQATIGFTLVTQLERELAARGIERTVISLVSRVLVDPADPSFATPTKPIGRWQPDQPRRLVPSPPPVELLDLHLIRQLLAADSVVVAYGGGGIPMARSAAPDGAGPDGALQGVEAVVDKDRCASLLADRLDAARLVIATDVHQVQIDYDTPTARALGTITSAELTEHLDAGQFPAGSMGPKVEAVCRFVDRPDRSAAIGSLDDLSAVVAGTVGTQITF